MPRRPAVPIFVRLAGDDDPTRIGEAETVREVAFLLRLAAESWDYSWHEWTDKPVEVRMRIGDHPEVPVGVARDSMYVPRLLRMIADEWAAGCSPDALEEPPPN